jgi:cytochrome P450
VDSTDAVIHGTIDPIADLEAAVEEVLRFDGPVQYDCRYSLRDVEMHGVTFPAGNAVMLLPAPANRDERVRTKANTFAIGRDGTEAQKSRLRLWHSQLSRRGISQDKGRYLGVQ